MSRTVIAAVVAAVIAVLTVIAFFVASTSFEDRLKRDADAKLTRAYQVVQQLNQLEGIDVSNKAERLAAEKEFVVAIKTDSQNERQTQARLGFQKFIVDEKQGAPRRTQTEASAKNRPYTTWSTCSAPYTAATPAPNHT